jgi:hypothetical protein
LIAQAGYALQSSPARYVKRKALKHRSRLIDHA